VNKEITQTKIETTVTPTDKKTSDIIKPAEETAKAPQKKIVKQKERGLYLGVMISPDISTVKFQSVKKTGVSMGIIAGYQVNKKLSIESGIAWAIKNYYSKGEYFSTDRVYSNPNAKIKSVAGVCNMIEVPVMIKYDLTTSFSISGGVSSYFMKKEDYDYIIVYNNGQPYPHSSTYKNSSTDLAAVADFAVGYNRQIKKGVTTKVTAIVKNTGSMDGEEVVQLYVSHQNIKGPAPLKALKGFQRIFLKVGESKTINFTLTPEQLSLISEDGKQYQPIGQITVSIGGGQPGIKNKTTSNVIAKTISIY